MRARLPVFFNEEFWLFALVLRHRSSFCKRQLDCYTSVYWLDSIFLLHNGRRCSEGSVLQAGGAESFESWALTMSKCVPVWCPTMVAVRCLGVVEVVSASIVQRCKQASLWIGEIADKTWLPVGQISRNGVGCQLRYACWAHWCALAGAQGAAPRCCALPWDNWSRGWLELREENLLIVVICTNHCHHHYVYLSLTDP